MSRPDNHRGEASARLLHAEQLGHGVAQRLRAIVLAAKRDRRHRVAQHAGTHRVALGVIGIQQAFRRHALDHLGQLPSQIDCILHAGLEALPAIGRMDVRGVAGDQHASFAVGRGLPRRIGEAGDLGGTVDAVVGAARGDERLAEIAPALVGRGADLRSVTSTPTGP